MRSKEIQNILDQTPNSIKEVVAAYCHFLTSEWYRENERTLDIPMGLEEFKRIKNDPTDPLHKYITQ